MNSKPEIVWMFFYFILICQEVSFTLLELQVIEDTQKIDQTIDTELISKFNFTLIWCQTKPISTSSLVGYASGTFNL